MKTYKVTVITTVREEYIVEAESEEEADATWVDYEPDIQATIDIREVKITEVDL